MWAFNVTINPHVICNWLWEKKLDFFFFQKPSKSLICKYILRPIDNRTEIDAQTRKKKIKALTVK